MKKILKLKCKECGGNLKLNKNNSKLNENEKGEVSFGTYCVCENCKKQYNVNIKTENVGLE